MKQYFAASWLSQSGNDSEERALTAATWSQQAKKLISLHTQFEVSQCFEASGTTFVPVADGLRFDHVHADRLRNAGAANSADQGRKFQLETESGNPKRPRYTPALLSRKEKLMIELGGARIFCESELFDSITTASGV